MILAASESHLKTSQKKPSTSRRLSTPLQDVVAEEAHRQLYFHTVYSTSRCRLLEKKPLSQKKPTPLQDVVAEKKLPTPLQGGLSPPTNVSLQRRIRLQRPSSSQKRMLRRYGHARNRRPILVVLQQRNSLASKNVLSRVSSKTSCFKELSLVETTYSVLMH